MSIKNNSPLLNSEHNKRELRRFIAQMDKIEAEKKRRNKMTEEEISKMLDEYALLKETYEKVIQEQNSLIDNVIPQEYKDKIEEIRVEFQSKLMDASLLLQKKEETIRSNVLVLGKSVAGKYFRCNYSLGKSSWDKAKYDKFVKKYPEISTIRKSGKPYTQFESVKDETNTETQSSNE